MGRKSKYNINAEWDDPYERQAERRSRERCVESFRIKMGVRVDGHKNLLVGPALVENVSQSGLLCKTKHALTEGQVVHLSISTRDYSKGKDFPLKFIGVARVVRVEPVDQNVMRAALDFGADLSEDMSFSIFIETLHSVADFKASL